MIATVSNTAPEIVCAIYLVAIALAAVCAALFMDNLGNQRSNLGAMAEALRFRESWVMSFLYIGTFGSFIGFSFAFGQVLQINFLAGGDNAAQASLHAAQIAFIGPLLGSIARPYGGKLSDRIGGGRVTMYTFIAMISRGRDPGQHRHDRRRCDRCPDGWPNDRLRRRFHPAVHPVRDR